MAKKIDHLDFHGEDLKRWQAGLSLEELGLKISAIAEASEAGDEAYLEQFPFIERIVYTDGTWRKIIRGPGKLDE